MFSYLYDMISAIRYHQKFLIELERQGVQPTPKNFIKLMYFLEKNWNLTPEILVRSAFGLPEKVNSKTKFKIKSAKKILILIIEFKTFKYVKLIKF